MNLKAGDPALLLVMRLRDEAHRFAISYHRLLRKKALTRSILEEVPGIGPKKRSRLLKSFGSLAAVKKRGQRSCKTGEGWTKPRRNAWPLFGRP